MTHTSEETLPRVLLVSTWYPSVDAPMTGIFVQRDAEALSQIADLHVVHLAPPTVTSRIVKEKFGRVHVTRIPCDLKNPVSLIHAARHLATLLAHADLLHTHAMSTLIPLRLIRVTIPWVHTEHWSGYVEWTTGWRHLVRRTMAYIARRPQILISVSSVLAQTIESLTRRPVRVIPNIVEFSELRERPAFESTRPLRIVAVGNLISRKRPLLAAQTCHVLKERGIPTSLTWVGEGPLRETLYEYCQTHGVELHLPGFLSTTEIAREYEQADISLFPTAAETFGLVGAEALAAGRPLVAGANGGQRDFVSPPAGILLESDQPADYADAVEALLRDTDGLSAEDIARPIRERFSAEQLQRSYQSIYDELLHYPSD